MTLSVIIVGTILALTAVIVYLTRAWKDAEKEKATSEEISKMAIERTHILEKERLAQEALLRKNEKDEEDDLPTLDDGVPFYPRLLSDKDRLN